MYGDIKEKAVKRRVNGFVRVVVEKDLSTCKTHVFANLINVLGGGGGGRRGRRR